MHRVAHVHNRTLKGRYEAATARSPETGSLVRPVEYLLWHEHPSMPGELEHVVEHGFRQPAEYARYAYACHAPQLAAAVRLARRMSSRLPQQAAQFSVLH